MMLALKIGAISVLVSLIGVALGFRGYKDLGWLITVVGVITTFVCVLVVAYFRFLAKSEK